MTSARRHPLRRLLIGVVVLPFVLRPGPPAGASPNECSNVTVGFFNGVFNDPHDAIVACQELRKVIGDTRAGVPIHYTILYNQTDEKLIPGSEDLAEVFIQRAAEIDSSGELGRRFELFWEAVSTGDRELLDRIEAAMPFAADALNALYNDVAAAVSGGLSSLLQEPPTAFDRQKHQERLMKRAAAGHKLLLIGHSQGSLFLNAGYDFIEPIVGESRVAAVYVAPAATALRGRPRYLLSKRDLVINALRGLGWDSVVPANIDLPFSTADRSGHELIATYLDPAREGRAKVATRVHAAIDEMTSAEMLCPPPAPGPVRADAGSGKVTLSWPPVADENLPSVYYSVYVASEPGVTPETYATLADGAVHVDVESPFVVDGLENGFPYWFVVTATNGAGESAPSVEVSATPSDLPTRPTDQTIDMDSFACVVLNDGGVRCWGDNRSGQLGNGTRTWSVTPVAAVGIDDAIAVTTGGDHTCALLAGGSVTCWGDNDDGQLGTGDLVSSTTPVPVVGVAGAVQVEAGFQHTCALLSTGGIKCWGSNTLGTLGNGLRASRVPTPVDVVGTGFTAVEAGFRATYALDSDGSVYGWGSGAGVEESPVGGNPTPVRIDGIDDAIDLTASPSRVCALLSTGIVNCWGNKYFVGGFEPPHVVEGVADAAQVAVASSHTCVRASGGSVSCWGNNPVGELGDGTNTASATPVTVTGISTAVAIAAAQSGSCAVLSDGTVRCWGFSTTLGGGSVQHSNVPLQVVGITNAR